MLTKAKWLGVCFAVVVIVLGGLGLYHKIYGSSSNVEQNISISNAYKMSPEAQKEAIEQAKVFEAGLDKPCQETPLPAVHAESKAEYTFSTGCIAPGWELKPE